MFITIGTLGAAHREQYENWVGPYDTQEGLHVARRPPYLNG